MLISANNPIKKAAFGAAFHCSLYQLYVKSEVHDVSIFYYIGFAFNA